MSTSESTSSDWDHNQRNPPVDLLFPPRERCCVARFARGPERAASIADVSLHDAHRALREIWPKSAGRCHRKSQVWQKTPSTPLSGFFIDLLRQEQLGVPVLQSSWALCVHGFLCAPRESALIRAMRKGSTKPVANSAMKSQSRHMWHAALRSQERQHHHHRQQGPNQIPPRMTPETRIQLPFLPMKDMEQVVSIAACLTNLNKKSVKCTATKTSVNGTSLNQESIIDDSWSITRRKTR